jgi:hypothetical protein
VQSVGGLEDALLHRTQHLLDYLAHLRLHLEPLELLYLEFWVLRHTNKIIKKIL